MMMAKGDGGGGGTKQQQRAKPNVCVENAILDMYGKCGALAKAWRVFDEMQVTDDAVSWNAIIAAYEQNGKADETLQLLVWMLSSGLEPDEFTFGSVKLVLLCNL